MQVPIGAGVPFSQKHDVAIVTVVGVGVVVGASVGIAEQYLFWSKRPVTSLKISGPSFN